MTGKAPVPLPAQMWSSAAAAPAHHRALTAAEQSPILVSAKLSELYYPVMSTGALRCHGITYFHPQRQYH